MLKVVNTLTPPTVEKFKVNPPGLLKLGFFNTIFQAVARKHHEKFYEESKIIHANDEEEIKINIRRCKKNNKKENEAKTLTIVSHGLNAHSGFTQVTGLADAALQTGSDIWGWDMIGHGVDLNHPTSTSHFIQKRKTRHKGKSARGAHAGSVQDLNKVIEQAITEGYEKINLIGVSQGGLLTLNYLSRNKDSLPPQINKVCLISTPHDPNETLNKAEADFFAKKYLHTLFEGSKANILAKESLEVYDSEELRILKNTVHNYRDLVAWSIKNGIFAHAQEGFSENFSDQKDYFAKHTVDLSQLNKSVPILVINAEDDPVISDKDHENYELQSQHSSNFFYSKPKEGGHASFAQSITGTLWEKWFSKENKLWWHEKLTQAFLLLEPEKFRENYKHVLAEK